jgi:hypothetical protein
METGMLHNSLRTSLLTAALLTAATTTAIAQPSAVEPAPAPAAAAAPQAPQTHRWDEVTHINGQLVPVGESNSYVKKFRRTNLSTNPIGWMVGIYGVSASTAINQHVAIRGDANYYNIVDSQTTGIELGVGVPIYLRRTYQGAFIEPGFVVRSMDDGYCTDESDAACDDQETTVGPQMLAGWHWTWDSGLNVAVAAGLGRNVADERCDDGACDFDDDVFFNGYFRVGYAF